MNINEFVQERKAEWDKLNKITAKLRPGSRENLSREDLWELGRLYSAAVSDLSLLRSSEFGRDEQNDVVRYLNSLVIRVHGMIYKKPPLKWHSIVDFIVREFPRSFRQNLSYVSLSAGIFVLLGLTGFVLGVQSPGFIELLVPERIISTVEGGQVWFNNLYTIAPAASSRLMTHNISVTFFMAASGITFGIGSVYLLGLNGLLIGSVAALCFKHDLSLEFWSFVLPHGSLELTAVFIAGASGLILGHALLDPGPYRRSEFLSVRGKEAGKLALGCVPLLILAGAIEGFFSPSPLPAWFKMVFAALMFLSLMGLLIFAGTGPSLDDSDSEDIRQC
ncbi:MAG: stage II sporulation protein M [Desulfomonile tiedjei]|uniref:Stage II sporulation protein M n=1 Tax=Desulfomonile tiedjei TaxID=2358 RepID=A0A9D6V7R0_9BACT|nr:stage II sporulation protein M [Desulfomonile tiedjei]